MVQIPGLTPGQRIDPTQPGAIPQGYSLGVPRDYSQGGTMTYDPRFATQLQGPSQHIMDTWNQRMGGVANSGARWNQFQQKPTTTKPAANTGQPQQSFAPNIQTGITVGPVMPQAQVQQTQNQLRSAQMTAPPQDAGQNYAPYMQHLNSLLSNAGNASAIDFGRDAAFANAQQMLGSQQARARAGTGWGGVALQQYGNQMGQQQQGLSMLLSLLGQFGV